ncbi:MAG: protein-disulfide reductase DsbD domain-containing protein [Spirochaetia bacterium]
MLILLLSFSGAIAVQAESNRAIRSGPVEARLVAENESIKPGKTFTVALLLRMDPGWHVYGKNPGDSGLPTTLEWHLPAGFSAGPLQWPVAQRFETHGLITYGYSEQVLLFADITPPSGLRDINEVTLEARAEWLACKTECLPGKADLELVLPVRSMEPAADAEGEGLFRSARALLQRAGPSSGGIGFFLALALAFVGGLILNLMPCVLPVISLKVISLARQGVDRSRRQGLLFLAGVLVSFWIIAAALIILRAGGQLLGWGFQLQNPVVVIIAAVIFFIIGLNLFGVFEIGSSLTRLAGFAAGRKTGIGAFLSGLFATIVATPCTAPFMGVAIGYALSHGVPESLGVFTALGLGMASPLLALSLFPGHAGRLPKPGPWMEVLRQVMGFPMMAAVVWMLFVLAGLCGSPAVIMLLAGMLAAGLGAWIWGRWGGLERSRRVRIVSGSLACVLILGGVGCAIGYARASPACAPEVDAAGARSEVSDAFWKAWSPHEVELLRQQGVPVFIDFTARWCLSCQVNERIALGNGSVRKRFEDLGIVALKADWTDRDDAVARGLSEYGRASVPLYLYFPREAKEPEILPELLTPRIVLDALEGRGHGGPTGRP